MHTNLPNLLDADRIVVAGKWNGRLPWIERAIASAARSGASSILYLGNVNVLPGRSTRLLKEIDHWCVNSASGRHTGIRTIAVVPGHHDDWGTLSRLFAEHPGEAVQLSDYVWALPRGYRFTIGGRSFLAFGGAPSVDFLRRIEGYSWWREELPSLADVKAAAAGGHADVLLTHDAGYALTPKASAAIKGRRGWSDTELSYADSGRVYVHWVTEAVTPLLHLHAHLDVRDSATFPRDGLPSLRVESLDCDGRPGNLVLLDLTTLRTTDLMV
ncbi:hypothetical protein [Microbacterium aurum]|uniref:hypothetical protein n=1 Tax=Microbacterium aurum TaxID=36805 RepID=UPI0012F48568|nr:hypothetical protein [Microbacterium aurum]MBM7826617.1 hypothetical protein [Microbacterium aurum]